MPRDLNRISQHTFTFSGAEDPLDCNDLMRNMCGEKSCAHVSLICPSCLHEQNRQAVVGTFADVWKRRHPEESEANYTLHGLFNLQHLKDTNVPCPKCAELTQNHKLQKIIKVTSVPDLIIAGQHHDDCIIAPYIKVPFGNRLYTLRLRGIVYGGQFHFTSRIIDIDGAVWYHDGQVTGSTCRSDGSINHLTTFEDLRYSGSVPVRKHAISIRKSHIWELPIIYQSHQ